MGTANKDDSTFTVTDKVYDRAVIIDFSQRNEASVLNRRIPQIHLGAEKLQSLFAEAFANPNYNLKREEYEKFSKLTDFVLDAFDVNFGNRILNQIVRFVPVYVACGGTSAKALDLMFSRKVLRKLEGKFWTTASRPTSSGWKNSCSRNTAKRNFPPRLKPSHV